MNHKLKALGLAFVAAFAMSAVAASSAMANSTYHAPKAPTVGTAHQHTQNIFKTDGGEVKCNTATFEGTQGDINASILHATQKYSGCTAFGIATTHINTNECTYTFTTPVSLGNGQFTIEPPHVNCPTAKVIEVTPTVFGSSVCTATIPPQTPEGGHVIATNLGSDDTQEVTVDATVTGIHYTVDGGGGLCGPTGGTTTNGTYDGSVTLKGYQDTDSSKDNVHNGVHEPITIKGP